MRFNIKYVLLFISFILSSINVYSQDTVASIGDIVFNSEATYSPGSGVSVHIDPKGVYELIDINDDGDITESDLIQVFQ